MYGGGEAPTGTLKGTKKEARQRGGGGASFELAETHFRKLRYCWGAPILYPSLSNKMVADPSVISVDLCRKYAPQVAVGLLEEEWP